MSGLALFLVIGLSVGMTLLVSFFLSRTVLKGMPSAFVLELPPFRRPQIGQVLVRSLLDRTIFVLGRAITAAAPAGAVIWLLQRIPVGDGTQTNPNDCWQQKGNRRPFPAACFLADGQQCGSTGKMVQGKQNGADSRRPSPAICHKHCPCLAAPFHQHPALTIKH